MALDAPLNDRQVEVLHWISEGCPDGRWTNSSYKTTTAALEWRGLVTVSKRGGTWSASILPAGTEYLATGNYPAGHRLHRVRVPRPLPPPNTSRPEPRAPKVTGPVPLKPTHQLVKDIVDAGGLLERDLTDDDRSYTHLVSIINRRQMAPDDKQVILNDWVKPGYVVLRFSDITRDWQSGPLPERVNKLHPLVVDLRTDNRLEHLSASLRPRAFRLLHAVVREAEARGHTVRVYKRPNGYVYGTPEGGMTGCLLFEVNGIKCAISLSEPQDRVPHEATEGEKAKAKRDNWYRIPTHDYVKSGRLQMTVATDSGYQTKMSWEDRAKLVLESRLCDVLPLFERWAALHAERKEAERLRQIAEQERREREDELAHNAYVQHAFGQRLKADLDAWELARRLRDYLAEQRGRVAEMTVDDERAAAEEWLEWCDHYVAKIDPGVQPIRQPKIKPPDYTELRDFRLRLGFGHRW